MSTLSSHRFRSPLGHFLAALAMTAAVFALAGCAMTGVNRGDVNFVSLKEEWRMGRQLERDVSRQVRLVTGRRLNATIDRMGQRIVRQTPMANLPWTFHIVDDPAVNAFNIPGGHVYVNTGLIELAGSTSELAAVIAHEVAHGVSRHGTERLSKARGLSLGAGLLLGRDPNALAEIGAQVAASGAMASFSRSDEREADALGIRYLAAAGYDPHGMADMFERMLGERRRRPSALSQFFATHPLTEARIRDARRRAARY